MDIKECVFESFNDYWLHVRNLDDYQRKIIFKSLSSEERERLQTLYKKGKWSDLFMRNKADELIDQIKEQFSIDLLEIKSKLQKNKSVYMKKTQWDYILDLFNSSMKKKHSSYVIGGITAVPENNETVLLIFNKRKNV